MQMDYTVEVIDESREFEAYVPVYWAIAQTLRHEEHTVPYYLMIGGEKVYFSSLDKKFPTTSFHQIQRLILNRDIDTDTFNFIFVYCLVFEEDALMELISPYVGYDDLIGTDFLNCCDQPRWVVLHMLKNIVPLLNGGLKLDKFSYHIRMFNFLSTHFSDKVLRKVDSGDDITLILQAIDDGKNIPKLKIGEWFEYELNFYISRYPELSLNDFISIEFLKYIIDSNYMWCYQILIETGLDVYAYDHYVWKYSIQIVSVPFILFLEPYYRNSHSDLSSIWSLIDYDKNYYLQRLLEINIDSVYDQYQKVLTQEILSLHTLFNKNKNPGVTYPLDKLFGELMIEIFRIDGGLNFEDNWKRFHENMGPGDIVMHLVDNIEECFATIVSCTINEYLFRYLPTLKRCGIILVIDSLDIEIPIRFTYDTNSINDMEKILILIGSDVTPTAKSIRKIVLIYGLLIDCIPIILLAIEHGACLEECIHFTNDTKQLFKKLVCNHSVEDMKLIVDKMDNPVELARDLWEIYSLGNLYDKAIRIFESYPISVGPDVTDLFFRTGNWAKSTEMCKCVVERFLSENPDKSVTDMINKNVDGQVVQYLTNLFEYGFDPHWQNDIIWIKCYTTQDVSTICETVRYYPNNRSSTIFSIVDDTKFDVKDIWTIMRALFEAGACQDDPDDMLEVARWMYNDRSQGFTAPRERCRCVYYTLSKYNFEINRLIDKYATKIVGPDWRHHL